MASATMIPCDTDRIHPKAEADCSRAARPHRGRGAPPAPTHILAQATASDERLGLEHQIVTLILGRQHQCATPAFSNVDRYANIIQVRKCRSIVRIDDGSEVNIVQQLPVGPRTASLVPTCESVRTDPHTR